MEQYRFYTIANGFPLEMFPIDTRGLQKQYTADDDDMRFSFKAALTPEFEFKGADFEYLYSIEKSGERCKPIPFEIHQKCNSDYVLIEKTTLRCVDGTWNLDDCTVRIKPKLDDEYRCYSDKAGDELNLFNLPIERITANYLKGTIATKAYTRLNDYRIDDEDQFGGQAPHLTGWRAYRATGRTKWITNGASFEPAGQEFNYYYAREEFNSPTSPGPEWISISGTLWVREPLLAAYRVLDMVNTGARTEPTQYYQGFGNGILFQYDVVGMDLPGVFDNGMLLNDILKQWFLSNCSLEVKSDFLQINPEADFAVTYPLFPDGTTANHIVFQKTDVKRPSVSGNATKALYTIKKLLTNICIAYNLRWKIEGGKLIIEHVSFFPRELTLNTNLQPYKKQLVRTRKYNYKTESIPRFEVFKFMESGSDDFTGVPIEYVGGCVSDDPSNREKTFTTEGMTTDVEYCLISGVETDKVANEGIVVMSTYLDADGKYYILTAPPTLEPRRKINNVMGWPYLHKHFHRHRRRQINGYMNGQYQQFISAIPTKRREKVYIEFCCTDTIDLTGTVDTDMGIAEIGAANYLMYQNQLELELLYQETPAAFCPGPVSFQAMFHMGDFFYFDTVFPTEGTYNTVIEITKPDGTITLQEVADDKNGMTSYNFGAIQLGLYAFRKAVVCSNMQSEWTEYTKINLSASAPPPPPPPNPCDIPLPKPVYVRRTGLELLFTWAGLEVNEGIEFSVTGNGATGGSYAPERKLLNNGDTNLVLKFNQAYSEPERTNIEIKGYKSGTYKFKFRKFCVPSQYSAWSEELTVNL